MADTWETLKEHLRVTHDDDDTFIERCYDDATELVNDYLGDNHAPEWKINLAILKTGAELYQQRDAPQGVAQFADIQSTPIRVARDPLAACKPLLRKHVIGIK